MKTYINYALTTISALFVLAAFAAAQSDPPAFNATQSYKIGDIVTYEAVEFKCLINETTTHPNPHSTYWDISFVYSGPITIPVGPSETMKTLTAAWNYISYARIANNSAIEIKLDSNYFEAFSSSFSLDHPYGSKISIVGQNNGAYVTFSNFGTGFVLDTGHALADFEGLTLIAPSKGTNQSAAFLVKQNACLAKLQNITLQNFDLGLFADSGGTIDNVETITMNQFILGGMEAGANATINVISPITIDGGSTVSSLPPVFGFEAAGGTINCQSCVANNCQYNFFAAENGRLNAYQSTSTSGNGTQYQACYYALDHAFLDASKASATGSDNSFLASQNSYLKADSSSSTGGVDYGYFADAASTINASGHQGGTTYATPNSGSLILGP
jgi:hypothetical protein